MTVVASWQDVVDVVGGGKNDVSKRSCMQNKMPKIWRTAGHLELR